MKNRLKLHHKWALRKREIVLYSTHSFCHSLTMYIVVVCGADENFHSSHMHMSREKIASDLCRVKRKNCLLNGSIKRRKKILLAPSKIDFAIYIKSKLNFLIRRVYTYEYCHWQLSMWIMRAFYYLLARVWKIFTNNFRWDGGNFVLIEVKVAAELN